MDLLNIKKYYPPNKPKKITQTENFKKWFGKSKIVDEKGNPLVVFHGTTADFSKFDKKFQGSHLYGKDSRLGFFFSDNNLISESYIIVASGYEGGGKLIPTFLKIENPYIFDYKNKEYKENAFTEIIETAIKNGNDGVIIKNVIDSMMQTESKNFYLGTVFIVFEPNQIKSAIGNSGKFSLSNEKIGE